MPIARYVKAEGEKKRYTLDYTDWLDTGELVSNVVFTVLANSAVKPLVIDGVQVLVSGLGVQYYASGGMDGLSYRVLATLTTTIGPQIEEQSVIFAIREP